MKKVVWMVLIGLVLTSMGCNDPMWDLTDASW